MTTERTTTNRAAVAGKGMTAEQIRSMLARAPFHDFLRLEVISVDTQSGELVLKLPFSAEYRRGRDIQQIHGGITACLVDVAGTMAVVASVGQGVPTVNLRIDYLRMAEGCDLVAKARIRKLGRTVACVDIDVTDPEQRLIAVGRGTYGTFAR
jgi:uncharacterized protein (TIGR00369 family)